MDRKTEPGKISFVIQDVRTSDVQSYQTLWKVIIPTKNGSVEVMGERRICQLL